MDLSLLGPLPALAGVRVGRTIGAGAFAVVKEAELTRPAAKSPSFCAVKYVHRALSHQKGLSDARIGLELKLHHACSAHPNVIHLLAYGTDNVWVYHVLELAKGGDLFDKIEPDIGTDHMLANFYFVQLVGAVDFLHRKGVAHRDIKPENILLDEDGNLKLADFGLAAVFRKRGSSSIVWSTDRCGSRPYVAPEVLSESQYNPAVSDVWACGIVLYVLLTGQIPWDVPVYGSSPDYTQYVDRKETEPWTTFEPVVKSLLRAVICPSAQQRLTIEQIRLHPWFSFDNELLDPDLLSNDSGNIAERLYSNLDVNLLDQPAEFSPPAASFGSGVSMSQPVGLAAAFGSFVGHMPASQSPWTADSQLKRDKLLDAVSKDPTMLQFRGKDLRLSQLTSSQQNMAKFTKLTVARMTRFFSVVPVESLVALIRDALHRLGVSTNNFDDAIIDDLNPTDTVAIHVTTVADKSKLSLKGLIVIEKCDSDVDLWKVEFRKSKGDPLDWRRLFKKITLLCRDAVYID